jgi:uncharacterized protein involved in exopolysaccharide biosynthesis
MPDIFYLVSKWWKQMLALWLVCILLAGVLTFIKPRQYLSVATALPASSVLADKSTIFNENIEGLYSSIGSPDDLDRIIGTAQLDTVYLAVSDQFNLYDHYKIEKDDVEKRVRTAKILKHNSEVLKSEYGELKVKVWDTDKNLAPQLANAIMNKLGSIYQDLQNQNNNASLNSLRSGRQKILVQLDSINHFSGLANITSNSAEPYTRRRNTLSEQLSKYEKLISEYELIIDNKPSVLMQVEKAKPALRPDKPRRLQIIVATAFISLFFALLLALVMERKNLRKQ